MLTFGYKGKSILNIHHWKSFFIVFHMLSTDDQPHTVWQLPSESPQDTDTLL